MAGRKRSAPEDTATEKRETRSSKVPRTEGPKPRAAKGAARLKTTMTQSAFMSHAVPLHVRITTTAPASEGQEPTLADPGLLVGTTLDPGAMKTGSFGWKVHKRVAMELPKAEGEDEGERIHVMFSINATVIGSKDVKEDDEHDGETAEHTAEEVPVQSLQGEAAGAAEAKIGEGESPVGEEHAEENATS